MVGSDLGSPDRAAALADSMVATLAHRGPDGRGTCVVSPQVVLAHRRLAVIDTSDAGCQPMTSRSGRWTVTFNGEIYNHRSLRSDLAAHGAVFRGYSDTETLVEGLDAWGPDAMLHRIDGMFAFAAFDTVADRLVIARDRMGEKPLYWLRTDRRIAFASELRAIRALPDVRLEIDPASATALLRWSAIPHPHTIYRDVCQLAPGALLDIDVRADGFRVDERVWWSLDDVVRQARRHRADAPAGGTIESATDELEQLLAESVAARMESDVPLGAFLSGGVDSSVIAALAQRALPGRLTTFTVTMPDAGPDAGFDESRHAARVAAHLGTDHQEIRLASSDAFDIIPTLPRVWDEPFADPSMLPNLLLCAAARTQLTVCLGGDGGDELFAGYNRHVHGAAWERRAARIPRPLRRAAGRMAFTIPPALVDRSARRIPRVRDVPNPGDKAQKWAALMRDDSSTWESLAGIWPTTALSIAPHGPVRPSVADDGDAVERMMLLDTSMVLPDQMLVKTDRASMAASLEVRAPFLDHRLVDWAWRQPTEFKTAGGVGKVVLRRLADRLAPPGIADRPKMGFDPPLGAWLRDELRPWASDLLAAPRCVDRGWIDAEAVSTAWSEHLAGARNRDAALWGVLMLEAWLAEHDGGSGG